MSEFHLPHHARCLLLLCVLLWPQHAAAHATSLGSSRLELSGRSVQAVLELNALDLQIATGQPLLLVDGNVDRQRLAESSAALFDYIGRHAHVLHSSAGECAFEPDTLDAARDHILVRVAWRCSPQHGELAYDVTLFHHIDPAARHMVTLSGAARGMGLLSASTPRMVLVAVQASLWGVAWQYLLAGVEHIAIGFDHIAFIIAVVLWGRRLWPLVGVVTAFTLAHSITLSLAALDIVTPPAKPVEALIALSIVYVAAENFFVRNVRRRWIITFLFGLVHGFGFAGALRDYGLPRDALVLALATFNIGVELGQIVIVVAAMMILLLIERSAARFGWRVTGTPDPRLVYFISSIIFLLGVYWTVQRLSG